MKRLLFVLLFVLTLTFVANAQVKGKQPVFPPGSSTAGPYTPAIVANGFVFVSGQIGSGETFEAQLEAVITNVENVLKASGSSLDHVVKTTVFLADMNDFNKLNEIYMKRLKAPYPARSTIQVARLPRDAKVEIEVIALVGDKK